MEKFTDKNFLDSVSNLVRTVRIILTCSNLSLMCFVLLSLNNGVILTFQALDQRQMDIFYYNFLLIIPRLVYFMAVYYGFSGSFRCSSRYLKVYLFYSIVTIGLFLIFALYWFFINRDANAVQFGFRRFNKNLNEFKESADNCTKSTVGFRRLDKFMKDYQCCDWNNSIVIEISDDKTPWDSSKLQCARNTFTTCNISSNHPPMAYCIDRLNHVFWITYFHVLLYISVFFLFVLNLFGVYLRIEIIGHRIRVKEHKTYTTVF